MDNYKKVIPYGPVWGQDALYDGNNKKKNKNKNTPARRKKFSNHHSFHNRQQSSLEPLGNKEKNFHRIMSMTKVTRNEIPTQRRKVFRIAKTNVKARTGIMTLSKSMGALRAERTHGLSLVDQEMAYRSQNLLQNLVLFLNPLQQKLPFLLHLPNCDFTARRQMYCLQLNLLLIQSITRWLIHLMLSTGQFVK